MIQTLHVTNGDSVVYLWRKAGLLGTHLAWRDVLHEGPVLPDIPLAELSRVRAQYLAARGFGNAIKIGHDFEKRDAVISKFADFEEIVLWFEHDLFDQLQLLQILDFLGRQRIAPGFVHAIQTEEFLGMMEPTELLALRNRRRPVSAELFEFARDAWAAFRSSSPQALFELSKQVPAGFRSMQTGLRRLFEEFPSLDRGVSRTQLQTLEAVAHGARRDDDLFRVVQAQEDAAFMGDSTFARQLEDLCAAPAPLVTRLEDRFALTPLGERVLRREADWLAVAPLDRWIGGTHLTATDHWRWDARRGALVEVTN